MASGGMDIRNHGVTNATTKMLATADSTQLIIDRTVNGITRSMQLMSAETRFNTRPLGVVSKNSMGARNTAVKRQQKK